MREKVYKILIKVLRSDVKIRILEALSSKPSTCDEIACMLNLSKNTLRVNLRELLELNLIKTYNDRYKLETNGKIIILCLKNSLKTLATIEKFKNFFESHYIEAIPDEYLFNIGKLWECNVITDTDEDLFRVHRNFLRILEESIYIYAVAPILTPGYVESVSKTCKIKKKLKFVITPAVLDKLQERYPAELKKALSKGHSIRISKDNIKLALTITDRYLALGLYTKDGSRYDPNAELICSSKEALSWGRELFKYYWDRSIPIEEYI